MKKGLHIALGGLHLLVNLLTGEVYAQAAAEGAGDASSAATSSTTSEGAGAATSSTTSEGAGAATSSTPALPPSPTVELEPAEAPPPPARTLRPSVLPDAARAQALEGQRIQRIELRMMQGPERPALRELIPFRVSQPLTQAGITRAVELLYRQGGVADVLAEAEALDEGVLLRFKVWPAITVRRLRFRGNDALSDLTLRAQLTLRESSVYSFQEAKAQAQLLQRTYALEGFRRARVVPEAVRAGRTGMDVTFRIKEGEQTRLRELRFEGVEFFPPRLLQQVTGFEEGRPLLAEGVEEGRQALQRFYRSQRHLEARIRSSVTYDADELWAIVRYDIDEGPQVSFEFYRTRVLAVGPLSGQALQMLTAWLPFVPEDGVPRRVGWLARRDLLRVLDVDDEQQLTEAFAEEAEERLRSAKVSDGYNGATVKAEIRRSTDGKKATFRFVIEPGRRVRLEAFIFQGNSFLDARQLDTLFREAMARFSPAGTFTQEALEQSLTLMSDYYRSQGFLDVRLSPSVKLNESALSASAQVTLQVEEGPRTLVREVLMPEVRYDYAPGAVAEDGRGLSSLLEQVPVSPEKLKGLVTLQAGEPYDPTRVKANVEAIRKEFARQGFVSARVEVKREVTRDAPNDVLVRFEIDPGDQARVGEIIVRGARVTRPEVIRREVSIQTGAVYNPEAIEKTRQNLSNTGLFQRVSLYPLGGERVRDLMVDVQERKAINASLSLGLLFSTFAFEPSDARLDSTLELTHYNVGGRGHRAGVKFELASSYPPTLPERGGLPLFPDYALAIGTDLLAYLDKASSRRLVFTYQAPWLLGPATDSNLTATFFERERQTYYLLNRNSLAWAVSGRFSERTSLLLQAQATLRRPELEETDPSMVLWPLDEQMRIFAQGSMALLHDKRDDRARPANGYLLSFQGELGQGLGCGAAYVWNSVTPCTETPLDRAEGWWRLSGSASLFWTPFSFLRLEARSQGGYLLPLGTEDGAVAVEKRFFLGGASTVRGFAQDWLGPHRFRDKLLPDELVQATTAVATGGNASFWYSTEAIVPLERLWRALEDLELALFRDAGNVWWAGASAEAYEAQVSADTQAGQGGELATTCAALAIPSGLRSSVGVGLRYRTSIGPMRFDVGFPQGTRCEALEPGYVMHISIGLF
ncbi:MAG: POTRA domain-containing protein [Myxococcota bacterium]